jgi:dimethylargininase
MDRLFDAMLVRQPSSTYENCVSSNPQKDEIDLQLALKQHRTYVSVLREHGIKVLEFATLERYPDSVFMQDPAILGVKRSVIGRFGELTRRGEEEALLANLLQTGHKSAIHRIERPGTLEGGDVIITDVQKLFVGESSRSNASGIHQLSVFLPDLTVIKVKTNLLHLLCGCSYLSKRTMIITPELISPDHFPGFKFVKFDKNDAYASDALYVGDGGVLIPSGFPKASRKLADAGYKPIEVDLSEFHKGDGGVTCLCSPIYNLL